MSGLDFEFADLERRLLTEDCLCPQFSCGDRDIDHWFRKKAQRSHSRFDCRVTTVHAHGDAKPVAFYALTWIAEEEALLEKDSKSKAYFPALHLEYLAVRSDLQGKKIGPWCMARVLDIFIEAGEQTAVPALTLVALDDRSEKVYHEFGFAPYARHRFGAGRRMLLPIKTALDLKAKVSG